MKNALAQGIKNADILGVYSLTDYYHFLDDMVKLIPDDRNLMPYCLNFYHFIDQSPEFGDPLKSLKDNSLFGQWTEKFLKTWGRFLDSPESAKGLESLYLDPIFNIDDYFEGPSGWLTFNQFFARQIRPGKRPIAKLCDDSIIVAPADSVFKGVLYFSS
jgi:hypothetical protein